MVSRFTDRKAFNSEIYIICSVISRRKFQVTSTTIASSPSLNGFNSRAGADTIGDNLHRCYEALVSAGIMPGREMPLVEAWLVDVDALPGQKRPPAESRL